MHTNSFVLFLPLEIWHFIYKEYLDYHDVKRLESVNIAFKAITPLNYWTNLLDSYKPTPCGSILTMYDIKKEDATLSFFNKAKMNFFRLLKILSQKSLDQELENNTAIASSEAIKPLLQRSLDHYLVLKKAAELILRFLTSHSCLLPIQNSLSTFPSLKSWQNEWSLGLSSYGDIPSPSNSVPSLLFLDPLLLQTVLKQFKPLQSIDDVELFSLLFASQQSLSPGVFGSHFTYDFVSLSVWSPTKKIEKFLVPHGHSSSFVDVQIIIRGLNKKIGMGIVRKTPPAYKHLIGSVCMVSTSHLFLVASTFLEFIETYASDLERGVYPLLELEDDTMFISSYPLIGPFTSTGPVIESLQIHVSTLPLLESIQGGQALAYSYQVSIMTVNGKSPFLYKLLSRHWKIMYSSNQVETVNGPGVIGLYPLLGTCLEEGSAWRGDSVNHTFRYESICTEHVGSRPVSMNGSFTFQVFDSRATSSEPVRIIVVPIAPFRFQPPVI